MDGSRRLARMSGQAGPGSTQLEPAGPRRVENPMPNDAPPMAALIEGRLDRLGLTPEEACRQAGLPADFLDRLAAGRVPPPRGQKLVRLAEALATSVSYLVGLDPDTPPPAELLEEEQGSLGLLAGDEEALLRAYRRLEFRRRRRWCWWSAAWRGRSRWRMRCRRSGSGGNSTRHDACSSRPRFRRSGRDAARTQIDGRGPAGGAAGPRPGLVARGAAAPGRPLPARRRDRRAARQFAGVVQGDLGQTVVVENRPGGGTLVATEAMLRTPPDGQAMLMVANSFTVNPSLHKPSPYDPLRQFPRWPCYRGAARAGGPPGRSVDFAGFLGRPSAPAPGSASAAMARAPACTWAPST